MYKRFVIIISLAPIIVMLSLLTAYADQHKKEEVSAMIAETQNRLSSIRSGPSVELVKQEITRIDEACDLSRKLLSDGKIDEAYNELTLGNLYFQMIDARIELQKALVDLDDTKKRITR